MTIIRSGEREFRQDANKIDDFRVMTDISRLTKGINPQYLNFDMKLLNPEEYSAPYHFHRYAEELFMIVSGSATLRSTDGFDVVDSGDILFFEAGENGAHQLYNHTSEPCMYLDIRTFIGHDICEYPDSDKIFIVPSYEIFRKDSKVEYFEGEYNVADKWKQVTMK